MAEEEILYMKDLSMTISLKNKKNKTLNFARKP